MTRVLLALILTAAAAGAQPSPSPSPTAAPSPSATPSPAPTPTPAPLSLREKINGLKDEEVGKAISAIREKFLDTKETSEAAVQRAALEGLVRRLAPGAQLVEKSHESDKGEATPFLAEIIDSHIGYIRLGSVEPDVLPQLDAAVSGFDGKKVDAVILDLRGTSEGGSFESTADIARRFCPKGKLLFSIQKPSAKQERIFTSNQDPLFSGVVVVLTDADTDGAAEALAATLRQNAGAMIVGADTTGGAAEFTDIPVSGDLVARVAIAQIIVPEIGPIFPDGVKPDVAIALPREVQEQIFRESKEKGVSQFVFENERRRMNEAALVANQNPEIDSAQAIQRERGRSAPLRDTVLQRAVDLVTAINFYKSKFPNRAAQQ